MQETEKIGSCSEETRMDVFLKHGQKYTSKYDLF